MFSRVLNRLIYIFSISCLCWATVLAADEGEPILLHTIAQLSFEPEAAFFLVEFEEENIHKIPALVVPTFSERTESGPYQEWILGAVIALPKEINQLLFSAVLSTTGGKQAIVPPSSWVRDSESDTITSPDDLREVLLQRKGVQKSLEAEVETYQTTLERLRKDANIIGGLDRIVDLQEEIVESKAALEGLETDRLKLASLLREVRTQKTPKNFTRRERELTKQLSEITQAASQTESSEFERQAETDAILQQKIAFIESTRYDNPRLLRQELFRLRNIRMQLEQGSM